MKNYYITHCDKNYLPVVEKLFESLKVNSQLKILFYTINFEYENKFENVIPIYYDCHFKDIKENDIANRNIFNNNETTRANMLFLKSKICQKALELGDNNYCYVDADCIALSNADDIFTEINGITNYPLLGENCHEYMIYDGRGNPFKDDGGFDINLCLEADLFKLLNIPIEKRNSLYRQSNIILYNTKCKSIINEWVDICYSEQVINNWLKYASFNDETVLNCILWKNDYLKNLKQISVNIPSVDGMNYSSVDIIESFIDLLKNPKAENYYLGPFCKIPSTKNISNLKFLHGKLNNSQYELIKENFYSKKEKLKYYITHCDEKYLANAEKLFESLELNSNYKILFYTVNFKYQNRFKNVIPISYSTQLIDLNNGSEYKNINNNNETEVVNLLFLKPKICNEALNYGDYDYCYIDADCIALKNCDDIFENSKNIINYPLLPKGPHEYICRNGKGIHFNNDGSLNLDLCLEADLLKFIGSDSKKRTALYRTSHIILFDSKCKNVLFEYENICSNRKVLVDWEKYAPLTDETVINCILWKYEYFNNLDQISIHVPSLEDNSYVSSEKFNNFIDAYLNPNSEEYMYENFTRIPSKSKIDNIKFLHGKINNDHFELVKNKIFKKMNTTNYSNKYLLCINSMSLGDTIAATPILRKLYNAYNNKISVLTYHVEIFKNNKYVDNLYDFKTTDVSKLNYKEKFETFLGVGGYKNEYGVEKKHNAIDIRQFHAIDLGFLLNEDEMEYDYSPDEYLNINDLPEKYVCIHASNTWPSRTYSDEKYQELINKLNDSNISVVLIGKNSSESGFFNIDKKTKKLNIKIGLDLTNKLNLSQCWHVINKSTCFVTMDSGLLHLAGTTDAFIIQLGSSINNKLRAPYRNGTQDYKYKYISGSCNIFCASDLKYGIKEWGTIQGVPPLINCLENKNSFECHPNSQDIFDYIKSNIKNTFIEKIEVFHIEEGCKNIHYRSISGNLGICKISIFDLQTNTILFSDSIEIYEGMNYWTIPGNPCQIITNDIRIIFFDNNNEIIFDKVFKIFEKDRMTPVSHLRFDCDLHSSNLWEIFIAKSYEHESLKVEKNDIVVDIGSNLSTFIHYALENGADKVYACEPTSYCISIINKYFKNNNKVIINDVAISDKNGYDYMYVMFDGCGANKITSVAANEEKSYINSNKEKVKVETFKNFIQRNKLEKIDFLKLDCEGGEVHVFIDENKEFFKKNVHKIAMEYHNIEKNNIIKYLQNLGYETHERVLSEGHITMGTIFAKNKNYNKNPVFLFLAPHLSTGGSPAYLEWLIESKQKENYECYVMEYCNYGSYDVQKKRIVNLVGENRFSTCGNHWDSNEYYDNISDQIINKIENINPEFIHLNELPEIFSLKKLSNKLIEYLYNHNRKFKLIETSHTSLFDFNNKKYLPDEFLFCSLYHFDKSQNINIPKNLLEFELPLKTRPIRSEALKKLDLDSSYFHVLNIGLFNELKNQKFLFELGEKLQDKKIMFHFVGNTCYLNNCNISDSQKNLPNCKIWQERNDVDLFMSSMDLFVFPSLRELNPISIKEALSWGMPCFINKLDTYCGKYDNNPLVNYINDDNLFNYLNKIDNA